MAPGKSDQVDIGYETIGEEGPTSKQELSAMEIFKEEVVQLKWRVLAFACVLTFGSYYIYDFPGAIGTGEHNTIESRFTNAGKNYNQEMNQALYSVYSWPNTVLALFGGILIDKFLGLRKAMALFTTLVFIGSVVFFFGVLSRRYALLIMGRVVFGLGGESLSVAQSAFVARWFKEGRGMALAFGITISFARVGSSFNFLFSPKIASDAGIVTAVLFGTVACGVSVASCIALILMDMYGERKGVVPPESKETSEPFKLSQIRNMPVLFWLASGMCVTVYCSVFPLIGIAKNFFQVKYDISQDQAAEYVSVYQFVCAGGSPLSGGIVDLIGRFSIWMIVAGSGFTLTHGLFLLPSPPPPWFMMGFMGIVYSVLVSSLWPAVPYVVRSDLVGLAYGIMTAMQNTGLAIWPLVVGAILDVYTPAIHQTAECDVFNGMCGEFGDRCNVTKFYDMHRHYEEVPGVLASCCNQTHCPPPLPTETGFQYTELFFMFTAGSGVIISTLLFIIDKRGRGVLGSKPSVREAIKEQIAQEEEAALLAEGGATEEVN